MKIHEALEKSNHVINLPRDMEVKVKNNRDFTFFRRATFNRNDLVSESWEPVIEPLTFEKIKKECVAGESLLVDEDGGTRLYLGFNRNGTLVTDFYDGTNGTCWVRGRIKDWKISEEKWKG